MAISRPLLPAKKGYVEVEVCGLRMYKNIETGELMPDGPVVAVPPEREDPTMDKLAAAYLEGVNEA